MDIHLLKVDVQLKHNMEELIEFLKDFSHVKIVYFYAENWTIHKPNFPHTEKTREEILNEKKVKKK